MVRSAVAVVLMLMCASAANAEVLHVDVECETSGRTKACPAFLLGFLDENKLFLAAPRASADVVVYVNAIDVALVDRLHLRFVGTVTGAPPLVETDAELDTRSTDDEQRAKLETAFDRGIALFVAAHDPDLVSVVLSAPHGDKPVVATSPWDFSFGISGSGSWSGPYQSSNGSFNTSLARTTEHTRLSASMGANGSINRQPALHLDDGTSISTDTTPWSESANLGGAYLFNDHWSTSGSFSASRSDPHSVISRSMAPTVGVRWDKYKANDPRGNSLSIGYSATYELDDYNVRDVLGESSAHYLTHSLFASGSIRKDKTTYSLSVGLGAEMFDPARRYQLSASPAITWQLGGHVDLSASLSVTKRQVVAPDPTAVDMASYAEVSQLSYAEPFSVNASFGLTFHWDRTNGARNDR
jgi:hypothetical protein